MIVVLLRIGVGETIVALVACTAYALRRRD